MHSGTFHLQVSIPSRWPSNVTLHKLNLISECNSLLLSNWLGLVKLRGAVNRSHVVIHVKFRHHLWIMLNTARHNFKTNYLIARSFLLVSFRDHTHAILPSTNDLHSTPFILMNQNPKLQVIYYVVIIAIGWSVPHWKSSPLDLHTILVGISHCREIIQNHIHLVQIASPLFQELHFMLAKRTSNAQENGLINIHTETVGRVINLISHKKLTEILCAFLDPVKWAAVRKTIVAEGKLSLNRCE
uniref:Uncharacterized protein n=1 Tax=Opuntia streptacantha TaxID=393608 RepID=A0A7C9A1D4_OPUST